MTPNPIDFLVTMDDTSQGRCAVLPSNQAAAPTVGRITDLLGYDLPVLLAGHRSIPFAMEVTR